MNNVLIRISGKDVVRFVKNLTKMKINFYSINFINKEAYLKVSKEDYLKIKKIKTLYEIDIIRYYGILSIINFIKTYKVFLIILGICFFMFLLLTNIIFEVEIDHNDNKLKEILMEELNDSGIKKYHFVVSYKKQEKIKEDILNKYHNDIEYLEIKRIGTKYKIIVEERLINNELYDTTPRNIIAKKNAIITRINASSGEVIGKLDSYVKKGDILISGTIHKKDEKITDVRAEGVVFGETWYNVTVEIPYHNYSEIETKNRNICLNINYLSKKYSLFCKKYINSKQESIFEINNSLLPVGISLDKKQEIIVTDNIYSIDKALIEASNIAKKQLYSKLGKNIEIIYEKSLKYSEINSKIIVVMFYKVIEDITDYGPIINSEPEIR